MNSEAELLQRVTRLEIQLQNEREARQEMEEQFGEVKRRIGYYDQMALKWGSFCLGFLTLGAILWAGVDKLKDKVLSWLP